MHNMDYIDAATMGTLSPHILPITDLKQILSHKVETLPPTMHLPGSSEDTLHFYHYLCTHILIANWQVLLLVDVPIQDHSQQLSIYKIFTLDISHGNFTACCDVNSPYLGITQDETMAVEILQHQFSICQETNVQFCNIHASSQPLANPPSCLTAFYTKNTASISTRCSLQIRKTQNISIPSQIAPNVWILTTTPSAVTTTITFICPRETTKFLIVKKPIHVLHLPPACSAMSPNFHLPPWYEHRSLAVNISLDMANLNMVNMSSIDFHIWQQLEKHQNESQIHHLASIPSVPVNQLYKHMVNGIHPITPFIWRVNRRHSINLDTVFLHRHLCNSYWIAYTSRIGDILLLLLLVLTCQISVLTFTTRYHAIYYCGWWCRGSAHLQMWWQGHTAQNTSQESWPAYGASTYMDRESI